MAAPSVPVKPDTKQQEGIVKYVSNCIETLSGVWNLRQQFLQRDLHYFRELDYTTEQMRARAANNSGDPKKLQNIIIPVVMPQVESALAYNAGVFLTGYPIFGVAAMPALADQALQMETVIADNTLQFGWVRNLIMFLRDTLKYNLGVLELQWKRKRVYSLNLDPQNLRQGKQQELYYEGNALVRRDPYNCFWDKRVPPSQVHCDGEFAGYTEILSRVQLKQLLLDLNPDLTMNGKQAFESGQPAISLSGSDSWYYVPQVNPAAFVGVNAGNYPTTNWMSWWHGANPGQKPDINYQDVYEVTHLYGKIIPSDFRLAVPARNQPQIWKFIVVNRKVLIYVERQTNAHNYLPMLFGQAIEDGLGYQTKSFLDTAVPFQSMGSALWNAAIAAKRRQVFDRIYYDPSRIRKEDIDKVTEVARVPVKQSAYGKPVSEAVHSQPFNDAGIADTLQMAQNISLMADEANGQNKVQRGQFQKGNKTKVEFQDTMSSANSRQQLQALNLEHGCFVPMKEMLKLNILQYQADAELYNVNTKGTVKINPQDLRKASLQFKISDGILPTDKLLSTDLLQVFMQTIQTSPLMQAEFDIVGAFIYWCKMQGAQWLDDFKRDEGARDQILQQLGQLEAAGKSQGARPQNQQNPSGAQ